MQQGVAILSGSVGMLSVQSTEVFSCDCAFVERGLVDGVKASVLKLIFFFKVEVFLVRICVVI